MNRIQSLDNAKGIGIILVVIGHSVDVFSSIGVGISSFHMPLFFILSGFLFNEYINPLKEFLFKRTKQLLIPFVAFSIMIAFMQSILLPSYSLLELQEKAPGALWFIGILYLAEIIYAFICNIARNRDLNLLTGGVKYCFV